MSESKNNSSSELKNKLASHRINAWDQISTQDNKNLEKYCAAYLQFLDAAKTEREAVDYILKSMPTFGYSDLNGKPKSDKYFFNHYGKSIALFRKGRDPITDGLNIIVAHIDSPRLDLKQHPLYEDEEIVFLKTHYYGGVKKYQWLSRPLAIHGVISLKNGKNVEITIGEKPEDPIFTIADLLPHLAGKAQMQKKASEFIPGEKLNLIVGTKPFTKDKELKERFKLNILQMLHNDYGIKEDDFLSADIEIVPAGKARELGFDRSLVAGYGQDDRVCAYAAFRAILDATNPKKASLVLLMDKEEIGSEGATGANTWFLEMVIGDVLSKSGHEEYSTLRHLLSSASCLSADVNGAMHPDWAEVHDKMNAGYLNAGMVISKFTGTRGKSGSNEANAEFIGQLRRIFEENDIVWHMAELGKVDEGGGGTIAKFMAYYGMNVIDAGVPVLDMHSPFEITSKADIWMTYKGFKAFLEN